MTRHVSREDRRTFLLHLTQLAPVEIAKEADAWLHERKGDRASTYRPTAVWALWAYFLGYRIHPEFDPVRAPFTEAKKAAIESGYSEREAIVQQLMNEGLFCEQAVPEVVNLKQLATFALEGRSNVAAKERMGESVGIGRALSSAGAAQRSVKVNGIAERLWAVRNIEAWKKRPDKAWVTERLNMPVNRRD
jgi:hypothetical protein